MMILRSIPIAIWCALVASLAPSTAGTLGDDDCALLLSGPGRTSAYDYTLNLLRGNVGYEGQQTCITYDAINQAYIEARKRILVAQPKGDWKPEDFASVGELVLDISINLARTYGLTYEEIEKGLPLVDTSRTLISEVCPPVFSHVECRAGKYRRLDGLCNNLENPTWGATNVPFQRLIGPLFADGINAPRVSHSGRDLPLSRVVSRTMHPDEGYHDHAGTIMIIAWGQFMDHDYTLTATPLDPRNRNDPEECCNRPPHAKHPYCNEIRIPDDDYFYRLFGVKCMDFVRAFPAVRPGCKLGSRVPFNTLTGAIDGNTVYGVTDKFARKLRTGYGGLLRMNDVFKEYGLKDLLPLKLDVPDEGCTRPNKNMYCFEGGEIRVNEQLVLTVMHTLMAREHNRVAKGLAHVNPHWDDETLYQEARRIVIAEIQHITYNEFLPIFLGKDVMEKFGLILEKRGYWNGYDPQVNPDVIDAFSAAAFRVGHTFLPTAVERWSKAHKFIASKRLSDLIRRPYDLYRAGVLDEYVMGLMNQVAQAMDDSITQEVTNHLFKKVGARFGMDLVSFNMQRGREFGVPGYMEFRKFCGLPGADTFQELFGSMPNETVRKYETIFEHPVDVDLWSGGVSERPLPGSMLGPTFACIIATQFAYSRRGDRFWYELPNQPSSFTLEQLAEVRKARMSRIICDNTDIIDTVQLYPMVLPDHELNPRVPCRSGIIPSMDFSKWAEPPPLIGAKQFVTDAIINHNKSVDGINPDVCEELNTTTNKTADAHVNIDDNNTNCTAENDADESSIDNINTTIKNNTDTVLKYVYKKNENDGTLSKNTGISHNALRKKRSLTNIQEHEKQPLIVNYETGHPKSIEDMTPELFLNYETFPPTAQLGLLPLPKNTNAFIKNSELASFDIRTHHGNPLPNNDSNKENLRANNQYYLGEPIYPVNYNNDISEERLDKSSRNIGTYGPSYDKFHPRKAVLGNSRIHNRDKPSEDNSRSSDAFKLIGEQPKANNDVTSQEVLSQKENYEPSNFSPADKPRPEKGQHNSDDNDSPVNSSNDSTEIYDDSSNYSESSEQKNNYPASRENQSNKVSKENDYALDNNSGEERSYESNYSPQSDNYKESNDKNTENSGENSSHENIYLAPQKIKLHSYKSNENSEERSNSEEVLDNSKEDFKQDLKLEPKDYKKNIKHSDIIQNVNPNDFSYERIKLNKDGQVVVDKENDDAHIPKHKIILNKTKSDKSKLSNYTNHAKIDNGEIKPVIEINSESRESTKEPNEDSQDRIHKLLPADSIETLDEDKLNKNHGAIKYNIEDSGNVKNDFERIPSNYSHSNVEKNTNKNNNQETENEPQRAGPEQVNNEDDTPFIIPEDHIPYDEHLFYKFDDPTLILPEIKFPEDVIAYNYEEPYYKRKHSDKHKSDRHIKENKIEGKGNRNLKLNYRDYDTDDEDNEDKGEKIQALEEDDSEYQEDDDRGSSDKKREEQEPTDEDRDASNEEDGHYSDEKKSNQKDDDDGNHPKHFRDNKDTDPTEYEEEDDGGEEERQQSSGETGPHENPDEDHNEDLYEKFVRERFGKSDTFEKRAARLEQDRFNSVNPKLRQTLGKILHRAGNTQKEAAKSGDPNAGFMWTLEYGGNL